MSRGRPDTASRGTPKAPRKIPDFTRPQRSTQCGAGKARGTAGVGARAPAPCGDTDKFAGIGGAVAYEHIQVRPVAKGTIQGYTVSFTGNWKLP
jgi:hypothetical protein